MTFLFMLYKIKGHNGLTQKMQLELSIKNMKLMAILPFNVYLTASC